MFARLGSMLAVVVVVGTAMMALGGRAGAQQLVEDPPVTEAEIEAALAPYGEWIDGVADGRAWRPDPDVVGDDFTPYLTNGQWVNGAYGWTFDSPLPWGWAAFHFGRWIFVAQYGWLWTPGGGANLVWGPAWVTWRTGGGYVGWVAAPPAGAVFDAAAYASLWNVVETRFFGRADAGRHLVAADRIAGGRPQPPPVRGAVALPRASWRGYPNLRATLAGGGAAYFVVVPAASGTNPTLWLGAGSSVHAPMDLGRASGASPLLTGPGSSLFASPGAAPPSPPFFAPAPPVPARGGRAARAR